MQDREVPSLQEMFNRAWNGLKSQGFEVCTNSEGGCVYDDGVGHHCAWGWVDLEGTSGVVEGSVGSLRIDGVGLASRLNKTEFAFAAQLQHAHDMSSGALDMKKRLIVVAEKYELTVPNE